LGASSVLGTFSALRALSRIGAFSALEVSSTCCQTSCVTFYSIITIVVEIQHGFQNTLNTVFYQFINFHF
jgi:hypothetical protein